MASTLSFITIFQRYGKSITKFLSENIDNVGKDYIPFNPATTKGTVQNTKTKTGKVKGRLTSATGTHPRMIVTGKTKNNAFKFRAEDQKLTIFIDSKYEDIINGNNLGSSFIRKNQVALFPTQVTLNAFENTPMIKSLVSEITTDTATYFNDILKVDIARTIKIG